MKREIAGKIGFMMAIIAYVYEMELSRKRYIQASYIVRDIRDRRWRKFMFVKAIEPG